MLTIPLKSRVIKPNEDLKIVILEALKKNRFGLKNGDILIIASKIVALSQGKMRSITHPVHENFMKLVFGEAEMVLPESDAVLSGKKMASRVPLTIKDGVFIPQAGIDFSNSPQGVAILWPEKPFEVARELWSFFKKKFGLEKLGIIISDSHCQPLRWGTTGLALAYAGFYGIEDVRGKKDIYGKPLKITKIAVADNLASAALLEMGEAGERVPFVIARVAKVIFSTKKFSKKDMAIKPKDCLFAPFYPRKWKK